jgi:hypothetical protein
MTESAEQRNVTQISPRWLTLLAGPLVWTVHFLVVYSLGEFGCRGGWLRGTLLGLPAPAVIITALTLVALVVSGAATLRTYRQWDAARTTDKTHALETDDRNRFMSAAGWMLGVLFTFLILLMGIPAVVLPQCA